MIYKLALRLYKICKLKENINVQLVNDIIHFNY